MARILVIDDDELLRETVREVLEDAGHEVEEAEDGVVGVRVFKEHPADLVITDIIMPNKEGIQTIWEIKQASPSVQIIAVSGGVPGQPESDLPLAETFGAARSIQKPFSPRLLVQTVDELLAQAA